MKPISPLFPNWCPFENPMLKQVPVDVWNLIFNKLFYQDRTSLKMTCRSFCILLSRPLWTNSPTQSALQSGVFRLLTTSNKHVHFIHSFGIRKISKKAVDIQFAHYREYETGKLTDMKSIGNRLLLLVDETKLVSLCNSSDEVNEFKFEWSIKTGAHHRIEKAVICGGKLCIEFSYNHGWVHHDGWGEDDGYDAISRTLEIIDLFKGEIIYSKALRDKEMWNAGGNVLLEYKVRSDYNTYFCAKDLGTMESLGKVIEPIGMLWETHIQQDTGSILFHVSSGDQHKLYKLSPD